MKRATCTYFVDLSAYSVLMADQTKKVIGTKGYGGVIKEGETPTGATLREVWEETGGDKARRFYANIQYPKNGIGIVFDPKDLAPVALIDFYNGSEEEVPFDNPTFRVLFYICYSWKGVPVSTVEMRNPHLYPVGNLPYKAMPPGDELFIDDILKEKWTKGWVRINKEFTAVIDSCLEPCTFEELVI